MRNDRIPSSEATPGPEPAEAEPAEAPLNRAERRARKKGAAGTRNFGKLPPPERQFPTRGGPVNSPRRWAARRGG